MWRSGAERDHIHHAVRAPLGPGGHRYIPDTGQRVHYFQDILGHNVRASDTAPYTYVRSDVPVLLHRGHCSGPSYVLGGGSTGSRLDAVARDADGSTPALRTPAGAADPPPSRSMLVATGGTGDVSTNSRSHMHVSHINFPLTRDSNTRHLSPRRRHWGHIIPARPDARSLGPIGVESAARPSDGELGCRECRHQERHRNRVCVDKQTLVHVQCREDSACGQ
jgi:hypothetical protein